LVPHFQTGYKKALYLPGPRSFDQASKQI
jgi:hypothetical protein